MTAELQTPTKLAEILSHIQFPMSAMIAIPPDVGHEYIRLCLNQPLD